MSDDEPMVSVQYRIESQRPGKREWEWVPASGFSGTDPERLRHRIELAHRQTSGPAWSYRIVKRVVVTETGPWMAVEDA